MMMHINPTRSVCRTAVGAMRGCAPELRPAHAPLSTTRAEEGHAGRGTARQRLPGSHPRRAARKQLYALRNAWPSRPYRFKRRVP